MFIANDKNGNRITIESAIDGEEYFCPTCNKRLTIKASESLAVKKHFAHKRGQLCLDDWHYEMSEWHRFWQSMFPENCREIVLNNGVEKHRADVLINNTVIEFQNSPITKEEVTARNNFYLNLGYDVVWVLNATNKLSNDYDDTIDPRQCRKNSNLRWKREKSCFYNAFPKGVAVYLNYLIPRIFSSQIVHPFEDINHTDIMIHLEKITQSELVFSPHRCIYDKTTGDYFYPYIHRNNFLKEYGVYSNLSNLYSVGEIINCKPGLKSL